MIAVVIRCQSYPGTYQFAAARLSGPGSTRNEGLSPRALGGGAHSHSQFPASVVLSLLADGWHRELAGYVLAGLRAARRGRVFRVARPAIQAARIEFFGAVYRLLRRLLLGNARFQLRQKSLRCVAERFHFRSSFVAPAFHEQETMKDRHDVVRARQGRGYE